MFQPRLADLYKECTALHTAKFITEYLVRQKVVFIDIHIGTLVGRQGPPLYLWPSIRIPLPKKTTCFLGVSQ
jgi:hypothetical protein